MLFGKKPDGKTLLVLDIEQGSVGSSLVRLSSSEPPRLFGETRIALKVLPTRDTISLLREVAAGLRTALHHAAQVASRLRNAPEGKNSESLKTIGVVSHSTVFLGAPWGAPSLRDATPHFVGL